MRRTKYLLLVFVIATIFTGACSFGRSDTAIATDIKAKMFSDPQLKDSGVQVAVSKGIVTLSGPVSSDAARLDAYKLAEGVSGVSKVNDLMTVQVAEANPQLAPVLAPVPRHVREPKPPRPSRHASRHALRQESRAPAPEPAPAPAQPAVESAPAPAARPVAPATPQPPQPITVEVPAGSTVSIRMIDGVDSSLNHTGEVFRASLDAPLVVDDQVVVPKGADVFVRLAQASSAGHMSGRSELRLELVKLAYQGKSYPLVSSTSEVRGSSRGKNTAAKVGGGAVLGAIIGGIAGGGKGAAIGATVGGGGGAVYQGVTHGQQVRIASESKLDFQLEQPVSITYLPRKISAENSNQ
ncbi:MAG: BON domain-containing protein [Candidatus Acidiferrales bacterium]